MQPSRIRIGSLLLAIGLVAATCGHAQDEGTVTLIRDASLRVIRGLWVLQAVEGMRLRQGDYLLTGSAPTTQAQLEFRDGSVVELGPSSRVYLFDLRASTTAIIVVAGWVKGETTRGNLDYFSHAGSVTTNGGRVLLHLNGDAGDIFVEHGAAHVSGYAPAPIASSAGKTFFTRRAGKPVVADRPSADFIGAMPVSFRDVLPARLDQFAGKKSPEPKTEREVAWSDVEALLTMPPASKHGLVERFKPRLKDRAFREAIEAHIAELPEWKPALAAENQSTRAPNGKSNPQ